MDLDPFIMVRPIQDGIIRVVIVHHTPGDVRILSLSPEEYADFVLDCDGADKCRATTMPHYHTQCIKGRSIRPAWYFGQ